MCARLMSAWDGLASRAAILAVPTVVGGIYGMDFQDIRALKMLGWDLSSN